VDGQLGDVPSPSPSLTEILGEVFHDNILNDMGLSAAFPEALKAGKMSMESLFICD
jgi:hypothetical protein